MEQRHCLQCDAPIEDEAKFCKNCGAPQSVAAAAPDQAMPANAQVPATPSTIAIANPALPAQPQALPPVAYQQPVQQSAYQQPVQQPAQQPYQQMPQYPYPPAPVQQVNVVMANNAAPVMLVKQKSVGVALLLTFLFGPLGMFYSTVSGAVIMLIVSVVLAMFTLGISFFITWPICMIWGAVAANSYNNTIVTRV
jgi:hypothetical protein